MTIGASLVLCVYSCAFLKDQKTHNSTPTAMPGRATLQVEGTFTELAQELADFLDNQKKDTAGSLKAEVAPLLEKYIQAEGSEDPDALDFVKDDILRALVGSSNALLSSSDRGERTMTKVT